MPPFFATMPSRLSLLISIVLVLQGCSSLPFFGNDKDDKDKYANSTEDQLYRNAQSSMRAASYRDAVDQLQALESRFPFGRYAEQAQLEIVYAHFMAYEFDQARASADRFIRLHPQHRDVDYAYYLKGLSAFEQDRGFFDTLMPTDPSKRDPGAARDSFADFGHLVARYPDSEYAIDARQRMIYLRNLLADSEVHIARYYMRREAYVAATNRGRYVVENFPQTPAVPDALAIMIEAYMRLGLEPVASDSLRVLVHNFPTYPSLDDAGNFVVFDSIRNRDRSWLNVVSFGLIDRPDKLAPLRLTRPQTDSLDAPGSPDPNRIGG